MSQECMYSAAERAYGQLCGDGHDGKSSDAGVPESDDYPNVVQPTAVGQEHNYHNQDVVGDE